MSKIYEICADEAWTHSGTPLARYWCFFGGIFGLESDLAKLEHNLKGIIRAHAHKMEIKWSNVSGFSVPLYLALLDEFFKFLETNDIKYRQLFLDRMHVFVHDSIGPAPTVLDTQYRVYYQFIKHHFGLKFLPRAEGGFDNVFIRLDGHSSRQHTDALKKFAEKLPESLGRTDLVFNVSFVNSKKHVRLQVCDLIMGAAGSHGNKMHLKRAPGRRGMTPKQKIRFELASYIYNKLRLLSMAERGVRAFNWFESTGIHASETNKYRHKIRIWKFIPLNHQVDKGWQNDHLDAQGNYVKPDIVDPKRGT